MHQHPLIIKITDLLEFHDVYAELIQTIPKRN